MDARRPVTIEKTKDETRLRGCGLAAGATHNARTCAKKKNAENHCCDCGQRMMEEPPGWRQRILKSRVRVVQSISGLGASAESKDERVGEISGNNELEDKKVKNLERWKLQLHKSENWKS